MKLWWSLYSPHQTWWNFVVHLTQESKRPARSLFTTARFSLTVLGSSVVHRCNWQALHGWQSGQLRRTLRRLLYTSCVLTVLANHSLYCHTSGKCVWICLKNVLSPQKRNVYVIMHCTGIVWNVKKELNSLQTTGITEKYLELERRHPSWSI